VPVTLSVAAASATRSTGLTDASNNGTDLVERPERRGLHAGRDTCAGTTSREQRAAGIDHVLRVRVQQRGQLELFGLRRRTNAAALVPAKPIVSLPSTAPMARLATWADASNNESNFEVRRFVGRRHVVLGSRKTVKVAANTIQFIDYSDPEPSALVRAVIRPGLSMSGLCR
jgi:hypothetical protein